MQKLGHVIDLPQVSQWLNFFEDILAEGFDHSRERIRGFQHTATKASISVVEPGAVDLQQGFTRVSVLIFITHWALHDYQQRHASFSGPELESLKQCPASI